MSVATRELLGALVSLRTLRGSEKNKFRKIPLFYELVNIHLASRCGSVIPVSGPFGVIYAVCLSSGGMGCRSHLFACCFRPISRDISLLGSDENI